MYTITDGRGYYSVSIATRKPIFQTRALAYTYDTWDEAKAVIDVLHKGGFNVRITSD